MESIHSFLSNMGLNPFEQDIFISCTKYPDSSVSSLARILQKPRSTIYDTLKIMIERGFIIQKEKGRGFTYSSLGYDGLESLLKQEKLCIEKKETDLRKIQSDLTKLQINNYTFTGIHHYTGPTAMQLIYTKIAKSTTLRAVYNPQKSLEHSHYTIQDLANILITNNIKSFEILPNNHTAKKYAQLLNTNINHVKYLQESDLEGFSADHIITDDTFYFISLAKEVIGIEIHNPVFVQAQKIIFDQLWTKI